MSASKHTNFTEKNKHFVSLILDNTVNLMLTKKKNKYFVSLILDNAVNLIFTITYAASDLQSKKINSYFADFKQVKKLIVILVILNKSKN